MKAIIKIMSVLAALFLLVSCGSSAVRIDAPDDVKELPVIEDEWGESLKYSNEMQLVCENNGIQLWLNGATTQLSIRDSASGSEYNSFPSLAEASMQSDGINAAVEFINNTGSQTSYNTMSDAIAYGQYSYSRLENGLRMTYTLGEIKEARLAPVVISAERMETKILSQLDEASQTLIKTFYTFFSLKEISLDSDKAILRERYPSIDKHDIYALGTSSADLSSISDLAFSTVEEIIKTTDYSEADMEQDHKDNGITLPDSNQFNIQISIDIVIENGDIVVTIPGNGLIYDYSKVRIIDLQVLPFLASSDKDNGSLMVPDGSGALIYFNNGKTKYEAYKKPVYGEDHTLPVEEKKTEAEAEIYAPVFGIQSPDGSLLGIIEQGDALAYMNASVAGKNSPVNRAYVSFQLCRYMSLNRYSVGSAPKAYQKQPYSGDLKLRYKLLKPNDGYVEMAQVYRKYLSESISAHEREASPVLVNFYGGVTETRTVGLIPVKTILPLTTFEQAETILGQLTGLGAPRIDAKYTYWANNGAENTAANKIKALKPLGGQQGLSSLTKYIENSGAQIYPDIETLYVKKISGFSYKNQASRILTDEMAYKEQFNMATLLPDEEIKTYIVSAGAMETLFGSLLKAYKKLDNRHLSLGSIGTDLNADYRQENTYSREETKAILTNELKKITDEGYSLSFSGGNTYVLPYASQLVDVPVTSSNNYLFDATVPFYPIALSGLLPVYSQTLNTTSRYDRELLACIEAGVFPKYDLMYSENSVLKETDYNFYGLYYGDWLDDIAAAYRIYNEELKGIAGRSIVGHEQLEPGVFRSRFDNGSSVYVNYTDVRASVDGLTVDPMSFSVKTNYSGT